MKKNKAELILTRAWQQQDKWLSALRPLSLLYEAVGQYQKSQYQHGKKPIYKASVPVLVIGNITVGGAGKTPLIIALVQYLQGLGIQVGVISRGYGGDDSKMPALVRADSKPSVVGDEPCLIVGQTSVPMAVCPKRGVAIELLLQHYPNLQLIISDDGLQHYALHRDVEWIVVDAERGFGNGKLLPEGFLREPLSRLDNATVIYHYANADNAKKSLNSNTMYLRTGDLMHLTDGSKQFDKTIKKVYALTGIGYPMRFFRSLKKIGFEIIECPKPDHYVFTLNDIMQLQNFPVIVTSKDAVKLLELVTDENWQYFLNVWILPVECVVSENVYSLLNAFLMSYQIVKTEFEN